MRILVATLMGVVMGVICASVASAGHLLTLTTVTLVWILLNRTIMGFVIGISGLKLHWVWNGIILGVIVGSIFSYYFYMDEHSLKLALLTPIGNAFYGFIIELVTTVVLKQPAFARAAKPAAAAVL
jgi:hypothetical protein